MPGIIGVVNLMMCRALQNPPHSSGERDPHVAVPKVAVGEEEHHQENVAVQQSKGLDAGAENIGHDAEHETGREPDQVDESQDLDRMLAQFGEGRQHFGGMVDLVSVTRY